MKNVKCKNVLFINYGGIGDEILFLPAIQGFKKLYPDCKITLALEKRAKGIKTLTNLIDDIIEVDIKSSFIKKVLSILNLIVKARLTGFDTVISSGKSPLVSIILYLTDIKTKVGYKTKTSFLLDGEVPLNENSYAGNMYFDLIKPFGPVEFELPKILYDKDFMVPYKENDFVLIHPGVSLMSVKKHILKCPSPSFWVELIDELIKRGENVILAGGVDDKNTVEFILDNIKENEKFRSMYMKTKSLYEMAGLIKKSKFLLCCDSAPLHIGVGVGANINVIFAPTNENKLVPKMCNIKVIKKDINCRPCLWDKRKTNCEKSDCLNISPKDALDCMK